MIDIQSDLADEDWVDNIYMVDFFNKLNESQEFDKNKVGVYIQITIHQEVHSLQWFKVKDKPSLDINVK